MDEADTHRRNLPISHHLIHYPCSGFGMMIFQFLFDFFSLFWISYHEVAWRPLKVCLKTIKRLNTLIRLGCLIQQTLMIELIHDRTEIVIFTFHINDDVSKRRQHQNYSYATAVLDILFIIQLFTITLSPLAFTWICNWWWFHQVLSDAATIERRIFDKFHLTL